MWTPAAVAFTGAAFAGGAFSLPSYDSGNVIKRQDPNSYDPNYPNAVRAPCPGMSTLANHGFINRDGRNITGDALQQGFLAAFNMGLDSTAPGAGNALALCGTLTGLPNGQSCDAFDLDQTSTPHAIEHDASLTADDKNMTFNQNADNTDFNDTIWGETQGFFGGASHINVNLANTARLGRIQQAQQADTPGWFLENDGGSLTEHGFYLTTMNDPTNTDLNNPQARLDWMDHWFRYRELPTALGWSKPSAVISNDYLQQIVTSVQAASTVAPAPTKRALVPVNADAASTQAAIASATSAAGPAPSLPNAYVEPVSPPQWGSLIESTNGYVSKVSSLLAAVLPPLL